MAKPIKFKCPHCSKKVTYEKSNMHKCLAAPGSKASKREKRMVKYLNK